MRVIAMLLVALAIAACVGPATNPRLSDYPCGYRGISCGHHKCCDEQEVCGPSGDDVEGVDGGAFSGCCRDCCCFVGPNAYALSVGPPKPQYPETR